MARLGDPGFRLELLPLFRRDDFAHTLRRQLGKLSAGKYTGLVEAPLVRRSDAIDIDHQLEFLLNLRKLGSQGTKLNFGCPKRLAYLICVSRLGLPPLDLSRRAGEARLLGKL